MCQLCLSVLAICFPPETYGFYILYAISLRAFLEMIIYKLSFLFLLFFTYTFSFKKNDKNKEYKHSSSYLGRQATPVTKKQWWIELYKSSDGCVRAEA